jgi:hypothetical protein
MLGVHLFKPVLSFGSCEHLKDKLLNQIMGAEIKGLNVSEKKAGLAANMGWRISGQWFLASLPVLRMKTS